MLLFEQAQQWAERFQDPDGMLLTLLGRGQCLTFTGRPVEGAQLLDQIMVSITTEDISPLVTGLAFCAPIMAWAATLKSSANFNVIFRFGITPLFLFSGVFFPVTRMPLWAQRAAWLTPLFHGVELVRGLTLGTLDSPTWMIHVGYLATMLTVGTLAGLRTFRRRLHS